MSLRNAPVTIALVLINVIVYAIDWLSGSRLMAMGAIIPGPVAQGEYYRIVTSGFLHFSPMHILFNMYALTQAGMVVENLWGSVNFILIYVSALLVGGIAAYETTIGTDVATAGASGAIMGLFGALAALGAKVPRLRATLLQWALFPIVATLAVGFTTTGISNADHIGGLIAGAIIGFIVPTPRLRVTGDTV